MPLFFSSSSSPSASSSSSTFSSRGKRRVGLFFLTITAFSVVRLLLEDSSSETHRHLVDDDDNETLRQYADEDAKYPNCEEEEEEGDEDEYGDDNWLECTVLANVKRASVRETPFDSWVYFCKIFPPSLYADMMETFPPLSALKPAKLSDHRLRYKIDGIASL